MCKFCDVKKGDAKLLDSCAVTNGQTYDEQILTLSINRNDDGVYGLVANHVFNEKRVVMAVEKTINFCPFCGRYLTRHD